MTRKTEQNSGDFPPDGTQRRKKEPSLADVAVLTQGAREPFTIANATRVGVTTTSYDGVLQSLNDFFGFKLHRAPALVLLFPSNRDRLRQLTEEGYSYPIPPEGSHEIGYTYEDENPLFIANPQSATRERVAQAGTRAYAYSLNPELFTELDILWEPAKTVPVQRTLPFTRSEITRVLSGEAITKGLATVVSAMTMLPHEEAATKLAGIVSGTHDEQVTRAERESYLQSKLATLQQARDVLVAAEAAVVAGDTQERLTGMYADAHRLKEEASETLGVFYVAGFLHYFSELAIDIRSDERKRERRQIWIQRLLTHPPVELDELLDPRTFFIKYMQSKKDMLADFEETHPPAAYSRHGIYPPPQRHDPAMEKVSGSRNPKGKQTTTVELPPFPLTNTEVNYFIAVPQEVHDPASDSSRYLTVPFYYHGMPAISPLSALLTPDVIRQYAHLTTDSYPADTADRITHALFDPIRQMDEEQGQQNKGSDQQGFANWRKAAFQIIRHCPPLGPDRVYTDTGVTLSEVTNTLLSTTEGHSAQGEPSFHETLLNQWADGTQGQKRLRREDQAFRAKTDGSKLSVGITLKSIHQALTTDILTGEGSILPNEQDRHFLQHLVQFIAHGVLADNEIEKRKAPFFNDTATEVQTAPDAITVWGTAQQTIEAPSAFEKNFIVLRAPIEEAEIPGFGTVFLLTEQEGFDPLLTPDVIKAHAADNAGGKEHMQEVMDTLFRPYEQTRDMVANAQSEYPEFFSRWVHPANALGFALFPYRNSHGEVRMGYGYRASLLHQALEQGHHGHLAQLVGISDETHDYVSETLSMLQKTVKRTLSDGNHTIFKAE